MPRVVSLAIVCAFQLCEFSYKYFLPVMVPLIMSMGLAAWLFYTLPLVQSLPVIATILGLLFYALTQWDRAEALREQIEDDFESRIEEAKA